MKTYYLIKTSYSEYGSDYNRICETLEEAESHLMEYADWYCSRGTCTIVKVDEELNTLETRYYREGKLYEVEQ